MEEQLSGPGGGDVGGYLTLWFQWEKISEVTAAWERAPLRSGSTGWGLVRRADRCEWPPSASRHWCTEEAKCCHLSRWRLGRNSAGENRKWWIRRWQSSSIHRSVSRLLSMQLESTGVSTEFAESKRRPADSSTTEWMKPQCLSRKLAEKKILGNTAPGS